MTESADLRDILIVLLAAVVVVPIFRRVGASAVLGYLVAGALIGPAGFNLIGNVETTTFLAQLGVVFLLFSIGLELSIDRLTALRGYVFGLGTAQVAATTFVLWLGARTLGLASGPALIVGSGLALSSTAVVLQMLVERRELATPHGRVAFAVLLFQDLAVLPLLALVPLLGQSGAGAVPSASSPASIPVAVGIALLKAAVALVLIVAAGRLALRPLLRTVARSGNPELFTGIILLVILGLGWLTERTGLSMALGAFLAGLLFAETEYRPQIEGDIQPFRGILLALFFMTVGMQIDLSLVPAQAATLAGLLGALLLIKTGLLVALARALGMPIMLAAAVGLMLAQGGEFGFVLFAIAAKNGVLSAETARLTTLVVGLSMAATPLLVAASRALLRRVPVSAGQGRGAALADSAHTLQNHVLIAGFGRVGQTLALLLEARNVPYIALDRDPERVAEARQRHLPVHFGDARHAEVLKAAGIGRARIVVVTLDEPEDAQRTLRIIRHLSSDIPALVRARDARQCERLAAAGATAVVPEIVEGSLQLGGLLLRHLGGSHEEIEGILEGFRRQTYARLVNLNGSGATQQ